MREIWRRKLGNDIAMAGRARAIGIRDLNGVITVTRRNASPHEEQQEQEMIKIETFFFFFVLFLEESFRERENNCGFA